MYKIKSKSRASIIVNDLRKEFLPDDWENITNEQFRESPGIKRAIEKDLIIFEYFVDDDDKLEINDSLVNPNKTWSSKKIKEEIANGTGLDYIPEDVAKKGIANGYASLDSTGKVPVSQLPNAVKEIQVVSNITARNALVPFSGLMVHVIDATADNTVTSGWAEYVYDGTDWVKSNDSDGTSTPVLSLEWDNITRKPSTFPPSPHDHNIDYYTKTQVDTSLASKSSIAHNHDASYYTHNEINGFLANKSDTTHTHSQLHDADVLGTKVVDESTIGNGKVLSFNSIDNKLEYTTIDTNEGVTIDDTTAATTTTWSSQKIQNSLDSKANIAHTHNATDINQDATHRFVTDGQVNIWTNKQNNLGFTPEDTANKGIANGYASLDSTGKVPVSQLPNAVKEIQVVSNITARNALVPFSGLMVHVIDATADNTVTSGWAEYIYNGTSWTKIAEGEGVDAIVDWVNIIGKPSTFPPTIHNHDDRYYTETEIDGLLTTKANVTHDHNNLYYTKTETDTALANKSDITHTHANIYTKTEVDTMIVAKADLNHNHDSRYYQQSQVDTFLAGKSDIGHNHDSNYYSKTQVDNFLSGKADLNHNHDANYYTKTQVDTALANKSDITHTHSQLHDADVLGTKVVDETTIGDGKLLSYDAVSGKLKYVTVANGSGGDASIDDSTTSLTSTWSSQKIENQLAGKANTTHTHNATDITQDTTHRFVTDTQITTWSNKQNALGFTPENVANKGVANGYASLDSSGKLVTTQLPTLAVSNITGLQTTLDAKASLASPIFTGTPAAPTALVSDSSTTIATTAFVKNAISASGLGDMTKAVYDTTNNGKVDTAENAEKLGGQLPSYYATATALDTKANTTDVYTKTEVDTALSNKASTTDLATKANTTDVYTKTQIDTALTGKADAGNVYTKTQIDNALSTKANTTDVYTKTQIDTTLATKANTTDLNAKANTTDVYTKTEVDTALATKVGPTDIKTSLKVGSTTITTGTVELVAGSNITLTPDTNTDKITISATGGTGSSLTIDDTTTTTTSLWSSQKVSDSLTTKANSTHTHVATDITQDTTHRFVTDTQITTWSNKQNALGFTPENVANKGVANGYASLDSSGKLVTTQLPTLTVSNVTGLQSTLDAKASLASPALTGTPTAPTAATTDSSTTIATTAFVKNAISAAGTGGSGDMTKAVYDTTNNGKVDTAENAEKLGGQLPNYYAAATALDTKANANDVYTKTEVDTALSNKASATDIVTSLKVGSTTIEHGTIELVAGNDITITPDVANSKITIASTASGGSDGGGSSIMTYEAVGSTDGDCMITATGPNVQFSKIDNFAYITPPAGVTIISARVRFKSTEIPSSIPSFKIDWDTTKDGTDYANIVEPLIQVYNDINKGRALRTCALNLNINAHTVEGTGILGATGILVKLIY